MQIGQIVLVKEKIGCIPPSKWIVIRYSGGVSALALFDRKDYRPLGCLSDEQIDYGVNNGFVKLLDVFKIKKSKKKQKGV